MSVIYIACPWGLFSGGPELAHQLCFELNQLHQPAKMLYYTSTGQVSAWDVSGTAYARYQTNYALNHEEVDQPDNILVIPETAIALYSIFTKCHFHIWWMSVDNYLKSTTELQQNNFETIFRNNLQVLHFVQSQYAFDYCKYTLNISQDRIHYLSDYINEAYMGELLPLSLHQDYIYYNPKKGWDIMKQLVNSYPDYRWVPIINMNTEQIVKALSIGKIYVDFGNHPGKDRIPREAAARGCCILTNRQGAAANDIDIPIPDKYKFTDVLSQFPDIIQTINDILQNYPNAFRDFGRYRNQIRKERKQFQSEVENFLRLCKCG